MAKGSKTATAAAKRPRGGSARAKKKEKAVTTDLAVGIVLDKSGSMGGLAHSVVQGFNEYMASLSEQDGETSVSLTLFDTAVTQPYVGVPLAHVQGLNTPEGPRYIPGGGTALYDSIAFTVQDIEKRLEAEGKLETSKILIVTLTDGQENSSKEYTAGMLADLVRRYEAKGNWTFVYLGLGQTQQYVGTLRGMGYVGDNGYFPSLSPTGITSSFSALGASTSGLRSSNKMSSKNLLGDAGIDINAADAAGGVAIGGAVSGIIDNTGAQGSTYKESGLLDHLTGLGGR